MANIVAFATWDDPVTCGDCQNFIKPPPIYERNSIGSCGLMDEWVQKHKDLHRHVNPKAEAEFLRVLGSKVFMTDIDRYCQRFATHQTPA